MAQRKSHLIQAIGLIIKTRPFLRARMAVYGVFFFATIGYFATFLLLLRAYNSAVGQAIVLAIALGLYLLGRRYLRRYLTYVGHAPHILAMVESIKGQALPKGHAQIEQSTRLVDERFPETTRLLQLEGLIGRVLREARGELIQPRTLQPIPGFSKLGKLGVLLLYLALRRFRDAIFGYALYVGKANIWRSAVKGLTLFAEHADKLARTAIRVYLLGLLTGGTILGLCLWAGWALVSWAQAEGILMLIVVLAGLAKAAWVVKTAVYDPVGLAWSLSVFLRRATEEPAVDEQWAERLRGSSKRFAELIERAKAFSADTRPPPAAAEIEGPPPPGGDGPPGDVEPAPAE